MSTKKNYKNRNWGNAKQSVPSNTGPIVTEEARLAEEQRLAACVCTRKQTTVLCTQCGTLAFGRVFRECTVHKNVVFLYDMRGCSKCQALLKYLEELPIDFETYQKLRMPSKE